MTEGKNCVCEYMHVCEDAKSCRGKRRRGKRQMSVSVSEPAGEGESF